MFQNGVIRGTLLAMRFMSKERGGKGGTVVNIGSNTSMRPYVSAPIYSATKHAVLGFTRSFGVSNFSQFSVKILNYYQTILFFIIKNYSQ